VFGSSGEQPPDAPANEHLPDGRGVTLAMAEIDFGQWDRDNAWGELGFNLDDDITEDGDGPCQPISELPDAFVHQDGIDGIDNAFGRHIAPMLEMWLEGFGERVQFELELGSFSYLFAFEALGDEASYYPVVTRLYQGAALGQAPAFDGKDEWPIRGDSLVNASDATSAKNTLHCSYVSDHIWVSEAIDELDIELKIEAAPPLALHLRQVVITMDLADDRKSADDGRVGGVIAIDDLAEALLPIMAENSMGEDGEPICDEEFYQDFLDELRGLADMRLDDGDGPIGSCNALSLGFGFTAEAVKLGSVGLAAQPPPDPCEDAGDEGPPDEP
jgi:hypothetical protein